MQSNDGTVYMIRGHSGDEWVSPEPAETVITDAVVNATDLTVDDIGTIESYVDAEKLRTVVGDRSAETLSFDVEEHVVTVTADGDIVVE